VPHISKMFYYYSKKIIFVTYFKETKNYE